MDRSSATAKKSGRGLEVERRAAPHRTATPPRIHAKSAMYPNSRSAAIASLSPTPTSTAPRRPTRQARRRKPARCEPATPAPSTSPTSPPTRPASPAVRRLPARLAIRRLLHLGNGVFDFLCASVSKYVHKYKEAGRKNRVRGRVTRTHRQMLLQPRTHRLLVPKLDVPQALRAPRKRRGKRDFRDLSKGVSVGEG